MRKRLNSGFLGCIISCLLLTACGQMAGIENEDLTLEQAKANQEGFTLDPYGKSILINGREYAGADCSIDKIVPNSGDYFVLTGETIRYESGFGNYYFSYRIYNTETDFIAEVTLEPSNFPSEVEFNIHFETIDEIGSLNFNRFFFNSEFLYSGVTKKYSSPLPSGWNSCNYIRFLTGTFNPSTGEEIPPYNVYYNLFGVECDKESLAYSSNQDENGTDILFSYSYEEEAEITLDFTFPQIQLDIPDQGTYTGADGKNYLVSGNGNVLTWTGNVSCSSINPTTFAFEDILPDCKSAKGKNKQANIWSDIKVTAINGQSLIDNPETPENEGPYSIKGDLDNITVETCN